KKKKRKKEKKRKKKKKTNGKKRDARKKGTAKKRKPKKKKPKKRKKKKKRKKRKKRKKEKEKKRMEHVAADSASLYAFGLRSTQAVFVQEALSIVIEPAFALLMSWLELPDDTRAARSHVSMYRVTRALFRFVASLLILRFCAVVWIP
ncbi:MAG: hypothetical protein EBZ77_15930, partial [Chitinophagia bacterium]|nr:hypothetical protein [Chitinophagia bacterium]